MGYGILKGVCMIKTAFLIDTENSAAGNYQRQVNLVFSYISIQFNINVLRKAES